MLNDLFFSSRICESDNLIIAKNAHLIQIEYNVTCLNTRYLSVSCLWMLTLKITYEVKEKTWFPNKLNSDTLETVSRYEFGLLLWTMFNESKFLRVNLAIKQISLFFRVQFPCTLITSFGIHNKLNHVYR